MPLFRHAFYGLLLAFSCQISFANPVTHHDFEITITPSKGTIQVQDTITLPDETSTFEFLLHKNMVVKSAPGITLTPVGRFDQKTPVPVQRYRVDFSKPGKKVSLHYSGTIQHSLQQMSQDYAGDLSQTPGIISSEGVYLSGISYWFPVIHNTYVTFTLQYKLPLGWKLVSQGGKLKDGWEERSPQDDIYLIAAPYEVYQDSTSTAEAMVYLRQADPKVAARYLDATGHYLDLYSKLLGPYPYAKFALVENFWETGYGMPSFTLLGPTVIRLPFIIHTSYPHEILHNWWGNGVYPDYSSGNWSEGLTSYLADHLLREQRGQGGNYRRTTLQRYADSVAEQEDFPLTDFRGRHGQASQAIGYGKTMMFFHMLRRQLGDDLFIKGLQHFYKKNLFKTAGFSDIQQAFEHVSNKDLSAEFHQWTTRIGAPALRLGKVKVEERATEFHLSATLYQTQSEPAFQLQVPILIQLAETESILRHTLTMTTKEAKLNLTFKKLPLRIKVDPQFDLFRRLDPSEIPSSLGQLFGAKRALIVLPVDATPDLKSAYQKLANSWAARSRAIDVAWDEQLESMPSDRAIWLFGIKNRLQKHFLNASKNKPVKLTSGDVHIMDKAFSTENHSFTLTTENPSDLRHTIGWMVGHSAPVVSQIGRKLPHYQKYSHLIFQGDKAVNALKGRWPLSDSALSITLPGGDSQPAPHLKPLPSLIN